MAKSSLSEIEQLHSVADNLWLKNATGRSAYSRTAPTWVSEVSVCRMKGRSRVGKHSMRGVTKASYSRSNADCLTKDQCPQSPCKASLIRGQQAMRSGRHTCYIS